MIIYKSKKKSLRILAGGVLLLAGGILFMFLGNDEVSGWIFIVSALMCLLLGVGQLADRKPQIVITGDGITDLTVIREEIEWDAIAYVDDFWYRGQGFVRMLLFRNYKPELVRPSWFWRLDKMYAQDGVKAIYIRTGGLDVNSGQLRALIQRVKKADPSERGNIISALGKKI